MEAEEEEPVLEPDDSEAPDDSENPETPDNTEEPVQNLESYLYPQIQRYFPLLI